MQKRPDDLNDDLSDLIGNPLRITPVTPPESYKPRDFTEGCRKCGGSGMWRPGYPCFTCKGAGKRTFKTSPETRAAAKASRVKTHAEKIEAFKAEYPDVWAWMDGSTFPPAIDMRNKLEKYGSLFDSSIEAARRMIAKRDAAMAAAKTDRTERENAAQTVNVDALTEAFAKAAQSNKRVDLWIGTVKIYPANPGSKWEGSLYVRDKAADKYLGRVTAGRFVPSRDGQPREAELLEIMQDPKAAAIKHGRLTGACSVCGRTLTDADSIAAGIGPICATKFGW